MQRTDEFTGPKPTDKNPACPQVPLSARVLRCGTYTSRRRGRPVCNTSTPDSCFVLLLGRLCSAASERMSHPPLSGRRVSPSFRARAFHSLTSDIQSPMSVSKLFLDEIPLSTDEYKQTVDVAHGCVSNKATKRISLKGETST